MSYGNYPDLTDVKKILVIKLRHHGDVLLSSPVMSYLKKRFPSAQIDVLIYKETLPMLQGHPDISEFILYDQTWKKFSFLAKLQKEISLFKEIYKNKYDLVINLTEGDRGALASLCSQAKIRVGFDPESKGFFGKKWIYTHLVKNCKTARHTVERHLDALRKIGLFPQEDERELTFVIPPETLSKMQSLLQEKQIAPKKYILVHPASRWRFKCLPPQLMADVIKDLHSQGKKIIMTSGPDEQELLMLNEIALLSPPGSLINLGGQISLKELGALIQLSSCVLCVDSVPLHIASCLKTPLVVLFGPSSDQNWGPWQHPNSQVVTKKISCRPCHMDGCGGSKMSDCLYSLSVKDILKALDDVSLTKKSILNLLYSKQNA